MGLKFASPIALSGVVYTSLETSSGKCGNCGGVITYVVLGADDDHGSEVPAIVTALGRELLETLSELRFPAWVEDQAGVCRFFNGRTSVESQGANNAEGNVGEARKESICAGCGVAVRLRAPNGWEAFALDSISLGTDRESPPFRVMVACPSGRQTERDRDLIHALVRRILKVSAAAGAAMSQDDGLTPQQRAVYRLLQRGLSYKEMASALGVAHSTVRVQVATLRKRLGKSRVPVLRR